MNLEIEPVHIGQEDDIDVGSVENFEHEEIDYAIFHLESGFFATQGHCSCEDNAYISEGNVEGEEVVVPTDIDPQRNSPVLSPTKSAPSTPGVPIGNVNVTFLPISSAALKATWCELGFDSMSCISPPCPAVSVTRIVLEETPE